MRDEGESGAVRVVITTVGCKLNQADSDWIRFCLEQSGHEVVDGAPADARIINTCTVTSRADHDSRRLARRARRESPGALVVVVGCLAETDAEALAAMPEVDWVVAKEDVPRLGHALAEGRRPAPSEQPLPGRLSPRPTIPSRARPRLIVQDGCDRRCAYCKVPLARGPQRSLPRQQAIEQARALAQRGANEIVVVGCNLGAYGEDLRPRTTLADLLSALLDEPLPRLRLTSIEPDTLRSELVRIVASAGERICPHLHIPLQSGSPEVLRAMRRPTDLEPVTEVVAEARQARGLVGIGLDLLVGYPTEGEEEFVQTVALVERLRPSRLHVFSYSPRAGTAAHALGDPVPGLEKRRRVRELLTLGEPMTAAFLSAHVGERVEVVVDRVDADGHVEGVTGTYARARVCGADGARPGGLVGASVVEVEGSVLVGKSTRVGT